MAARFSTRTGWDASESELASAIRHLRASGRPVYDLTVSNPTVCDFVYDTPSILAPLNDPASMTYEPNPRGIRIAREAVATYYADHLTTVDPDSILLTTSTSEAYSYLFRLLCDRGDEVLVAQPSYPLFDFLADLEDVRLRPYPLFYDYGWWIDFATLERAIGPRTRAILLVHPNNPTGHPTHRPERVLLEALCVRHNLALIVDEVFLDYSLGEPLESFAAGPHPALTFIVSGLSKIAALPQMKAAWLAAFGPPETLHEALSRLEIIADTFLSMSAPVQHAIPAWLEGRHSIQRQILERVRQNLAVLQAKPGIEVLTLEAGWCAVVRLPYVDAPEERLLKLVIDAGVIVHPGSFYGMGEKNRIVISLLQRGAEFTKAVENVAEYLNIID